MVMEVHTEIAAYIGPITSLRNSDFRWKLIGEILGPSEELVTPLPYGSTEFELCTPSMDERRERLVGRLLELEDQKGIGSELWCMSDNLKYVTETVGTHRALETVYLGPDIQRESTLLGLKWAHHCLMLPKNAIGPRNRLRIVQREFRESIDDRTRDTQGRLDVLSIAAGSSRSLMTVMHERKGDGISDIHLTMVDNSAKAKADAQELASKMEIDDRVTFIPENVFRTNRYLNGRKFNFIEVVGLLDYLTDEQVIRLLSKLWDSLTVGGVLLYSNIVPNTERSFLERVVKWPVMQYREADALLGLGKAAGVSLSEARLIQEPQEIYNLIAAKKS